MKLFESLKLATTAASLRVKNKSPEILMGVGIIGFGLTVVTACKATLKINDILEEPKKDLENIHHFMDHPEDLPEGKVYTIKDGKKDIAHTYFKIVSGVSKLYALPIALGTVSISCFFGSHYILTKRNAAITAAYTAVNSAFKEYRKNVVDRFGEEVDKELRFGVHDVVETEFDGEGNETTTVTRTGVEGMYTFTFNSGCPNWRDDRWYNEAYLKQMEAAFTQKLVTNRDPITKKPIPIFLNEVLKELGIPIVEYGQDVGWCYDENNPDVDNCVSFVMMLKDEYSNEFLLDFNCQGCVRSYI